tara:strand:+ start:141 stop:449 length:309 start_codon:yes stop_codon:yes gene_type:complete
MNKNLGEKMINKNERVLAMFAEWNKPAIHIYASSLINAWKKLKKDFPTFNTKDFDGVDIIYRDLSDLSGDNDVESLGHGGIDFRDKMAKMLKGYRSRIKGRT